MNVELANLRDLGGLRTRDGSVTRSGVLFRSDAPYEGDVDRPWPGWPPSVVIDLRSRSENELSPRQWPDPVLVQHFELYERARPGAIDPARDLMGLYRRMLRKTPRRMVQLVELLSLDGSTLIHCAAGKDRTGVVVAMLLALAGVSESDIVRDYLLTGQAMPAVVTRLTAAGGLPADLRAHEHLLATPLAAIRLVLDEIGAGSPGGVRRWYLDHGGDEVALETWLDRFVIPTVGATQSGWTSTPQLGSAR